MVLLFDMGWMCEFFLIDEEFGFVCIQVGVFGFDFEDQFNKWGWMIGYYLDLFIYLSFGGWIVIWLLGMQFDKYGDIVDIVCGLYVVWFSVVG